MRAYLIAALMGILAAVAALAILWGAIALPVRGVQWWSVPAASVLAAILAYWGVAMSHEVPQIREFLKQAAVWLSIVALLPLLVWYGTAVFHPPPDDDKHQTALNDIAEREVEAEDNPAKKRELLRERHAVEAEYEAARAAFGRSVFWVACPLGLAAFIVGSVMAIQSVGSALMFGGLFALTTGCYSYWDKMDSWLRFGSLLVSLAVVLTIGVWRFRSSAGGSLISGRPAA